MVRTRMSLSKKTAPPIADSLAGRYRHGPFGRLLGFGRPGACVPYDELRRTSVRLINREHAIMRKTTPCSRWFWRWHRGVLIDIGAGLAFGTIRSSQNPVMPTYPCTTLLNRASGF